MEDEPLREVGGGEGIGMKKAPGGNCCPCGPKFGEGGRGGRPDDAPARGGLASRPTGDVAEVDLVGDPADGLVVVDF